MRHLGGIGEDGDSVAFMERDDRAHVVDVRMREQHALHILRPPPQRSDRPVDCGHIAWIAAVDQSERVTISQEHEVHMRSAATEHIGRYFLNRRHGNRL